MNIYLNTFFAIVEDLKVDEGFKGKPYLDTQENWTIGYGHNMEIPISQAAGEFILKEDLQQAIADLDRNKPWWVELPEQAQRVVINMCFNMGWPVFRHFVKFWAALECKQYRLAAAEIHDSRYARQVKGRAERLAQLLESCAVEAKES